MFGLIGNFKTMPGKRDEVLALMSAGIGSMPGCLSYVIAADNADDDTIWVTEVWENEEYHQASLQIPEVRATIEQVMPLLAGGESTARTTPVFGVTAN